MNKICSISIYEKSEKRFKYSRNKEYKFFFLCIMHYRMSIYKLKDL